MFAYWLDTMHGSMIDEKKHDLHIMLVNYPMMRNVRLPESRRKTKK